jgi:D-3-phosphoglycerate dehydrogenase / 2-oxoglutarate reductase
MSEMLSKRVLVTDYAWPNLDIEREILSRAGASLVEARTASEEELLPLAAGLDGILTCWKKVPESVVQAARKCVAIGRYGIGLDNIPVRLATAQGIIVTNVPAYCLEEVSDHAMALLLSAARKVTAFDRAIKSGSYNLQAGTPLYRLRGRTLGIVGFGKIGQVLARKAQAFGLNVIAFDVRPLPDTGVPLVPFGELLARSDYVSIHVPLTEGTRGLFNADAFARMKLGAVLINTARGEIVDEPALLAALDAGPIGGAALDVLAQEPPDPANPLIRHPKVIVTPHAAFNSEESLVDLKATAAEQMAAVLTGRVPENIVNPEVLESPSLRARFQSPAAGR